MLVCLELNVAVDGVEFVTELCAVLWELYRRITAVDESGGDRCCRASRRGAWLIR